MTTRTLRYCSFQCTSLSLGTSVVATVVHTAMCVFGSRTFQFAADCPGVCRLQEDMYSYVTYSDDQSTKGKGTAIVEA